MRTQGMLSAYAVINKNQHSVLQRFVCACKYLPVGAALSSLRSPRSAFEGARKQESDMILNRNKDYHSRTTVVLMVAMKIRSKT